jgi:hypothetical protein
MMVLSGKFELTDVLEELTPIVANTACACDSNCPRKSGRIAMTVTCSTESLNAP